jgi:hypothetical protein
MTKCRYCNGNLSFRQLKCPVCRNYVLRSAHVVVGIILTVIIGVGTILVIDYLAVNTIPEKPPESTVNLSAERNPASSNPGSSKPCERSNPNHPRPAHKRQLP